MRKFVFTLLILLLSTAVAIAGVTVSNQKVTTHGTFRAVYADLAFDSSYPAGGESLTALNLGLQKIYQIRMSTKDGYSFEYDYTNDTIKVFASAPAIVYEEKHTAATNAVTLDYPAAWIINIADTTSNQKLVKTGTTAASLGTDEVCLSTAIADGTRTTLTTAGASDVIYVTYVTQAWAEIYDLLVQEEAVTLATGGNATAYSLMALGYVYAQATFKVLTPVDTDDTTADGEIGVDFGTNASVLDANSAQDTYTTLVTYLKMPSSGWLFDRFIDDEDPTTAAATGNYSAHTLDFPVLLWGLTGFAMADGGPSFPIALSNVALPSSGSYTPSKINWKHSGANTIGGAQATGSVFITTDARFGGTVKNITQAAYLKGWIWEIPNTVPLEVKNTKDLSGLTSVKVQVIGY